MSAHANSRRRFASQLRDLPAFEERWLLQRVRGGAETIGPVSGEPAFQTKRPVAVAAKNRIAACAVQEFVGDGDVLSLEGGTIVAALLDHLPVERVSLLTNSLPVTLAPVRSARTCLCR